MTLEDPSILNSEPTIQISDHKIHDMASFEDKEFLNTPYPLNDLTSACYGLRHGYKVITNCISSGKEIIKFASKMANQNLGLE